MSPWGPGFTTPHSGKLQATPHLITKLWPVGEGTVFGNPGPHVLLSLVLEDSAGGLPSCHYRGRPSGWKGSLPWPRETRGWGQSCCHHSLQGLSWSPAKCAGGTLPSCLPGSPEGMGVEVLQAALSTCRPG